MSHLYNINGVLAQQKNDVYLANACEKMKEKYLKYWKNIPHLFVYASLMDPKFRLHGTQALVDGIAENLDTTINSSMSEYLTLIKDFFLWLWTKI